MRAIKQLFVLVLFAVALQACALMPQSYEQKVASAEIGLTAAINLATTLTTRGVITADEKTCVGRLLHDADDALKLARGTSTGDKLTVALDLISKVEVFLLARENRQPTTSQLC